jgi:signal transduction histidine kinase
VASVRTSVEALEGLFAQLLDLSQLEAGAVHPAPMAFALEPLFTRVAADLGPQAIAHELTVRTMRTRLAVYTDPVLLERVVRNFVSNAVRYTRTGGVIVGARRRECGAHRRDR